MALNINRLGLNHEPHSCRSYLDHADGSIILLESTCTDNSLISSKLWLRLFGTDLIDLGSFIYISTAQFNLRYWYQHTAQVALKLPSPKAMVKQRLHQQNKPWLERPILN